jgi:hypothetical protein
VYIFVLHGGRQQQPGSTPEQAFAAVPVDPTCGLQIPVGGSVTLRMQPTDFVGPPHILLSVADAQ